MVAILPAAHGVNLTRTPRMTHRRLLALALLLVALISAGSQADKLGSKTKEPGLRVVHLSGTPAEIGLAHGEQLSSEIAHLEKNYLRAFFAKNPAQHKQALMAAFMFRN